MSLVHGIWSYSGSHGSKVGAQLHEGLSFSPSGAVVNWSFVKLVIWSQCIVSKSRDYATRGAHLGTPLHRNVALRYSHLKSIKSCTDKGQPPIQLALAEAVAAS